MHVHVELLSWIVGLCSTCPSLLHVGVHDDPVKRGPDRRSWAYAGALLDKALASTSTASAQDILVCGNVSHGKFAANNERKPTKAEISRYLQWSALERVGCPHSVWPANYH